MANPTTSEKSPVRYPSRLWKIETTSEEHIPDYKDDADLIRYSSVCVHNCHEHEIELVETVSVCNAAQDGEFAICTSQQITTTKPDVDDEHISIYYWYEDETYTSFNKAKERAKTMSSSPQIPTMKDITSRVKFNTN